MPRAGLIAEWTGVLVDATGAPLPSVAAAVARLRARNVVVVAVDHANGSGGALDNVAGPIRAPSPEPRYALPRPSLILAAAKEHDLDLPASWLVGTTIAHAHAAAQAGCAGCVLISVAPPTDDLGIVVAQADNLADAPRVMIPRGGGCWHQ